MFPSLQRRSVSNLNMLVRFLLPALVFVFIVALHMAPSSDANDVVVVVVKGSSSAVDEGVTYEQHRSSSGYRGGDESPPPPSDAPKWVSLFHRRFLSMPDATLCIHDVGIRRLITSASGVVSEAARPTTKASERQNVYAAPASCQNVSVASFLVASKVFDATAEVCFLDRLYSSPPSRQHHSITTQGRRRPSFDDDEDDNAAGHDEASLRFVLPYVKLRLSARPTIPRGGISDDSDVQSWLESTVGPIEFSIVTEMKITTARNASSSSSLHKLQKELLFSRASSGFSVYNKMSSQYLLFAPVVVGSVQRAQQHVSARSTASSSSSSTPLSSWWATQPDLYQRLLSGTATMELAFNVKIQREAFWAVNEAHHRVGGRTNVYVVDKGHTVAVPPSMWKRWLGDWGGDDSKAMLGGSLSSPTAVEFSGLRRGAVSGTFTGWWQQHILPEDFGAERRHLASLKGFPLVFGAHADRIAGATSELTTTPSTGWMITGDSQSRSMYRALRNDLTRRQQDVGHGGPEAASTAPSLHSDGDVGGKILAADKSFTASSVSYRWDNYLENVTATLAEASHWPPADASTARGNNKKRRKTNTAPRGPELVVAAVGMGSHPASWGQYTLLQYQQASQRVSDELIRFACASSSTSQQRNIVWYGAPAWPKPKPVDKFRITNSRLGLFNYAALSALDNAMSILARGASSSSSTCVIRHLDFFAMTLPVLKWSKDGSHFDKTMVMEMVVRELRRAAQRRIRQ
jgi:hypothetical protein